MKYLGGKHGIGKQLADYMNKTCDSNDVKGYLEPFCGSLGVFKHMTDKGYNEYIAADTHPDLILMWKNIKNNNLKIPKNITENDYKKLKYSKSPNALKAVAGFGLSFGGKYFAGYAQKSAGTSGRVFLTEFKNSIDKIKPKIQTSKVKFYNKSYDEFKPKNMLIYCDPPYKNTQGYSTGSFDHLKFWNTMREWSKTNCVFISEESAPADFKVVWKRHKRRTLDHSSRFQKVEKLYMYKGTKHTKTKRSDKHRRNNKTRKH
jgi:DNA adenine methylase